MDINEQKKLIKCFNIKNSYLTINEYTLDFTDRKELLSEYEKIRLRTKLNRYCKDNNLFIIKKIGKNTSRESIKYPLEAFESVNSKDIFTKGIE